MNSTLTVRIDDQIKQEFTEIVNELGLDPPTVVRMLMYQTVHRKSVPLSLSLQRNETASTMNSLDEVRADWSEW